MSMDREIISEISRAGERLGFQLRPRQQEVVFAFMKSRNVFVAIPTESGKSFCYSTSVNFLLLSNTVSKHVQAAIRCCGLDLTVCNHTTQLIELFSHDKTRLQLNCILFLPSKVVQNL